MLTKHGNEHLLFLKEKIQEIKLAKFNAEINSVLQLPNSIISTLKVDDEGYIWFFASCNRIYAVNMDKTFYASLEYYNKESHNQLHIEGKANIVEDGEDTLPFAITKNRNNFDYNVILIRLKILKAEYRETKHVTTSIKDTVKNIFIELFYADKRKQFNFFETVSNDFT